MSSSAVRQCLERDAQHAESSAPSYAVRRCVERDVQHADIPCAVFCTLADIASIYRAGCPACQQFKLLGSSARFVRDAPLSRARPSSTRGVELFLPLFSRSFCVKCGVCQLSNTLRLALNPRHIPGSDCILRCTMYVSICPEPDVHSWIRLQILFWRLPYKCVIVTSLLLLLLRLCLCQTPRRLLVSDGILSPVAFVS